MGPVALGDLSMSEKPTVIKKTREEALEKIRGLLASTPYRTVGELREAVFGRPGPCCYSCHGFTHPDHEAWEELGGWLYLADIDWRTAP